MDTNATERNAYSKAAQERVRNHLETGAVSDDGETEQSVEQSVEHAAELAVRIGVDLDTFMAAAYGAYLDASPDLREKLESRQLIAQIDELRRRGTLAAA